MPSSWQEFQFLQQSVAKYAQGSDALPVPAADLAYAQDFGEKLDEIYPVFKNVISVSSSSHHLHHNHHLHHSHHLHHNHHHRRRHRPHIAWFLAPKCCPYPTH